MKASRSSGMFLSQPKSDGEAPRGDPIAAENSQKTSVPWLSSSAVQSFLHYEIQTKLGQGGMGIVYKAIDKKLNRAVALKFLPPQIDRSSADLKRFLQEAQALSALNHPHIATIFAVEDFGGQQFLVLEYLPGGTLKAKLQEASASGSALAIDDIFKYAQQTAEGLAHAHSRGIVHRDVKTSNLMLSADGTVKITDFGVAKLGGSSLATVPGSLMGTIAYMSPEQALGMEVDARSDVFSFGACLFELVTGRLPFEAPNDAALITMVASARAPDLKDFRGDVPAALERVVQRAMKKRAEDRYQTMGDLLQDLQVPAPANLQLTQTRPRISVRTPVATPRRARRVAAASLSLVAVVVGVLLLIPRRPDTPPTLPPPNMLLVVLRLRNASADPANQVLCDGLTKLLTNKLSAELQGKVDKLRGSISVVPANEVIPVGEERRQEVTSAPEARRVFGADLVVKGNVLRVDGRVTVTLSLVDAAKEWLLGAAEVSVPVENLSELQESLPGKVIEMLNVPLKPEAHARVDDLPKNSGAYELYLKGLGYLQRYDRSDYVDNAIEVFQKALDRDPNYALAHAGIAEAYLRKYAVTKETELISRAREHGYRALRLNADLSQVHYTMGLIHLAGGHPEFAIERFKNSIKIQPEPDAYRGLAKSLVSSNKPQEAEAMYQEAIQMNPTYWAGYRDLAAFYQDRGRFEEALPLFEKVIQLTPDNYFGWTNLGGLYLRLKGEEAKAIEYFQRANSITPTGTSYHNLGTLFLRLQRYEEAIEMYKKAIQLIPTEARHWGGLGDVYREMHSEAAMRDAYAHAIGLVEKELLVNPSDGSNWVRIALWRVATDKKKALEDVREALRLSPHEGFVLARAASVYAQCGMHKEALEVIMAAVDQGYSLSEIESFLPLVRLLQDSRFRAFMEERDRKSAPVPPSSK